MQRGILLLGLGERGLQLLDGRLRLGRHVRIGGRGIEHVGDLLAHGPERGTHADAEREYFSGGRSGLRQVGDVLDQRVDEIILLFALRLIARPGVDGDIEFAFAGVQVAGVEILNFVSAVIANGVRRVADQLHRGTFTVRLRDRHLPLGVEDRRDEFVDLPAHVVQEAALVAVYERKAPEREHVVDLFKRHAGFLAAPLRRVR